MNLYRRVVCVLLVATFQLFNLSDYAAAQTFADQMPRGWEDKPLTEFLTGTKGLILSRWSREQINEAVAQRADATAHWVSRNDWTDGTAEERILLVNLLNSDLVDAKQFSARWSGYLLPPQTGTYTLSLWDYYQEDALDIKVWVDHALVLDCSGAEFQRAHRSKGIPLVAGQPVPIKIELRFLRTDQHKIAKPNVILSWESDGLGRQIIPAENYQPPEDYLEHGRRGLKAEYFASTDFENPVQTRLDTELSYLWDRFAIAPRYADLQHQIATHLMAESLAKLDGTGEHYQGVHPAWAAADALEGVLTTQESIRVLEQIKQYPQYNATRSTRDLFLFYWRFRHLPDNLSASLVEQWCKANPVVISQFGTYPNYDRNEYYGNYNYFWRLGNHLVLAHDEYYLKGVLAEQDGACNESLAAILTFAHNRKSGLPGWRRYLEEQLNHPELTGDAKASWLLARAFADEVPDTGEPIPLAGRAWMQQALEQAGTEKMRRQIVHELACRMSASDLCDQAAALIDSHAHRFEGEGLADELTAMRNQVEQTRQKFQAKHRAADKIRSDRQVYELQRRLNGAQSRGDREAINQLSRQLQDARRSE